MDLKNLFPNASTSFLKLHGLLDAPIRDTQFERPHGEEPLDTHPAQERSKGRVVVIITRFGSRLLDRDNLYGGVKPLVDALRYDNLIPDDNDDSIELIVRQKKVRKDQIGTQVIII